MFVIRRSSGLFRVLCIERWGFPPKRSPGTRYKRFFIRQPFGTRLREIVEYNGRQARYRLSRCTTRFGDLKPLVPRAASSCLGQIDAMPEVRHPDPIG